VAAVGKGNSLPAEGEAATANYEPGGASGMTQIYCYGVVLVSALVTAACGGREEASGSSEPANAAASAVLASQGMALSDHPWRLVAIDMLDGEDFNAPAGSEPTVIFSEEANPAGSRLMMGSTGCSGFNATYDAGRGGRLVVGRAITTRMACPDEVMRIEQFFLTGLKSTRTYTIDDSGLWIDFGGGVLHFAADDAGSGTH